MGLICLSRNCKSICTKCWKVEGCKWIKKILSATISKDTDIEVANGITMEIKSCIYYSDGTDDASNPPANKLTGIESVK